MLERRIHLMLKIFLSAIFVASAAGKFFDATAAALNLSDLLQLSPHITRPLALLLGAFELAVAGLLWRRAMAKWLMLLPLAFGGVLFYTSAHGQDCGCFGNLPLLGNLSFSGHLLMLLGMLLGFWAVGFQRPAAAGMSFRKAVPLLALALLVLSFMTLFRVAAPPPEPGAAVATLADVRKAIADSTTILVDARSAYRYEIEHIPGAVNIPHDTGALDSLYARYRLDGKPLIVYCAGSYCDAAERLAARLRNLGHKNVRVFPGGWDAWYEAQWEY